MLAPTLTLALALTLALVLAAGEGRAQDLSYFRIATGSPAGTYFPVGKQLAGIITLPPGSNECGAGGRCGVPGMIAVAEASAGSVANVEGVAGGRFESALAQADIVHWGFHGESLFSDRAAYTNLRVIANLYPESIHLVVRKGAGIKSVNDLRGRRVSVDLDVSGSHFDAQLILEAHGIGPGDFTAFEVDPGAAADMMLEGTLDAYFFVAGVPAAGVADLAAQGAVELVNLSGPAIDRLRRRYNFLTGGVIPGDTYEGIGQVETLTVGAQWIVSSAADEQRVYEITRALWHPTTREILDQGHERARNIRLTTALTGVSIPLHAGALRYYLESGALE